MRKIKDGDKIKFLVKGDDIHLATDMISLAYEDAYDTAIIVTGDGDFVPAIKKVQKLGKKAENAFFKVSSSNYLKQVCNKSIELDRFLLDCLRKIKKSKNITIIRTRIIMPCSDMIFSKSPFLIRNNCC